jgi:hypothetical protein
MIQTFLEMVEYEGYTYEGLCAAAGGGGGGKSGGDQTAAVLPTNTVTDVGDIGKSDKTVEEVSPISEDAVDVKKMGTRGLQIPLTSTHSTPTAATTGIQV